MRPRRNTERGGDTENDASQLVHVWHVQRATLCSVLVSVPRVTCALTVPVRPISASLFSCAWM
jgi:hypothetical protein